MGGWIFFTFDIPEFFHPDSVPGKSENSSSKIGALQIGPKTQNTILLKTSLMMLITF
jgi:hypothetical protein